jgi:eukaryotic-like serine/threonine-protein kinase
MTESPKLEFGACSSAGRKPENQDAFGYTSLPKPALAEKGIVFAIADGISTSIGAKEASEIAVSALVHDYYASPLSWDIKESATHVLDAANRRLMALSLQKHGLPRAMATTLSGVIIQGGKTHIFHVGDTRVALLRKGVFSVLTQDHHPNEAKSPKLDRALGDTANLNVDYTCHDANPGDLLILTSDGVHGFLSSDEILSAIGNSPDLEKSSKVIVAQALEKGSGDNVTCLLAHVNHPGAIEPNPEQGWNHLPVPPLLSPGHKLDGYEIIRELHASSRTQIYLVTDATTGERMVLKAPSPNYSDDPEVIAAFSREIWVGSLIDNPNVMRVIAATHSRSALYYTVELIEGQTLRQWMLDHPNPDLATVRDLAGQLVKAIRGFHRRHFVHLDLKPDNIMIDDNGTLKIIDFGSATPIGGADRRGVEAAQGAGTINYSAPEVLRGEPANNQADIYSLGVIVYEMLTGQLPYGTAREARTARSAKSYHPARNYRDDLPAWLDHALASATHPRLAQRFEAMSTFLEALKRPSPDFNGNAFKPLIERNPVGFWRGLAIIFFATSVVLLALLAHR